MGVPDGRVEIREGSILDPSSLASAFSEITHVVHCAGATKAKTAEGFYAVNQIGVRNLVEAANAAKSIRRFVLISSLAAAGPGTVENPAKENAPPRPISHYGRSKLAGEEELRSRCRSEFVIIRPPAVYGPRDRGFLPLFKAVRRHLRPCPPAAQKLSLVYVKDLAEIAVQVLTHPDASGGVYFAAGEAIVSAQEMATRVAAALKTWTIPLPLPTFALWPVCLWKSIQTAITGVPDILSLAKFPELRAPGWVCDSSPLTRDLGLRCATDLEQGVRLTLAWYEQNGWL